MSHGLIALAINNFSLFKRTSTTLSLLRNLTEVTGIPAGSLLWMERRMRQTQSLAPLRELLVSPQIPRAEKFRYQIGLKQVHAGQYSPKEQVRSVFGLSITTNRGTVEMEVLVLVRRRMLDTETDKQSARILVNWRISTGQMRQTFRQQLAIGDRHVRQRAVPHARAA